MALPSFVRSFSPNGFPLVSIDGGQPVPDFAAASGLPSADTDFKAQTLATARERAVRYAGPLFGDKAALAAEYFTRVVGSDLNDAEFGVTPATGGIFPNAPAQSTLYSGGVYTCNNAGVFLNPGNPNIAAELTARARPLIMHTRGEPWFVRSRVRINAATFTTGGGCTPISLSTVAGATTNNIQLIPNGTTTQMSLWFFDATGNSGAISVGADGVLGSDSFPSFAWVPISLFFLPGIGVGWEFNDKINSANFCTQAQMDKMPEGPAVIGCLNSDSMAANFAVDALACAYSRSIG
jgi:hypothetical protein